MDSNDMVCENEQKCLLKSEDIKQEAEFGRLDSYHGIPMHEADLATDENECKPSTSNFLVSTSILSND